MKSVHVKMLRRSRVCVQRPSMWARWCQSGWRIKEEGVWEPRGTPVLLESTTQVGLEREASSLTGSSKSSLAPLFFQTFLSPPPPVSSSPSGTFAPPASTRSVKPSQSFSTNKSNSSGAPPPVPPPFPKDILEPGKERVIFLWLWSARRKETGTHGITGEAVTDTAGERGTDRWRCGHISPLVATLTPQTTFKRGFFVFGETLNVKDQRNICIFVHAKSFKLTWCKKHTVDTENFYPKKSSFFIILILNVRRLFLTN